MDRRHFLKVIGFTTASLVCLEASCSRSRRLNFLFILVDDLGWKDLGCYGSSFYETPHIDGLAAEGMRFTDAYAACPVCSPTRASILSGKYPARMDTTDWFGAPQPDTESQHWLSKPLLPARYIDRLPLEETTLAEAFSEAGYRTFFAGKWHLGPSEEFWPGKQGFEINKGGWAMGMPNRPGRYFSPYGNPRLADGPEGEHLPARLARETCDFIRENRKRPFLAYLSFYSVHTPLQTRPDLEQKYHHKKAGFPDTGPIWSREGERKLRRVQEHAVYAGMVEAMDQAVGRVLATLQETGVAGDTAVVLMSDNGGLSTSEGHPTSNLPLRAGKGWLYEGGIREPMLIKWPGEIKPGSVCSQPVISTDFYPTLLEMAGLAPRPDQHVDGKNLVPLLRGRNLERGPLFWHYPHYGNQGGSPGSAVRDGRWKLIHWYEGNRLELYDLETDIGETVNLAERQPDVVKRMQAALVAWLSEVDAKFPKPNPKKKP